MEDKIILVTCVNKTRDSQGRIVSYTLEDEFGNQKIMEPLNLKAAIINGDIAVNNLKLTSDGRLIDSKPNEMNTRDDILGISDDYNAGIFVGKVAEQLGNFGIDVTTKKLDTHSELGVRKCAIIKLNNGKLIGTSGNEFETSAKIQEILANTGIVRFGITTGLNKDKTVKISKEALA